MWLKIRIFDDNILTFSIKYAIVLKLKRSQLGGRRKQGVKFMSHINQRWLLAIGIAIPVFFPDIAHAKPADEYVCPPRDEMCKLVDASLRRHVEGSAVKPKVVKSTTKTTIQPVSPPTAASDEAAKAASEAEHTVRDFNFAMSFAGAFGK